MARISAADRRASLIQAALRIMAREGVAAATTRAIVAEADMPLASFHYAFRSRDELIAELIAFVVEHEAEAAASVLTIGGDLRTTLELGLRAFMQLVASDPLREQAMFELTQYALRTPELEASARLQYDSYYRASAGILTAVAEHLDITWSRPIEEMSRILITLTDGLTLGWLVNRDMAATEQVIDFAATALAALAEPNAPAPAPATQTPPIPPTPTPPNAAAGASPPVASSAVPVSPVLHLPSLQRQESTT